MDTNRLIDDVAREMTGKAALPLRGRVLARLDRRPPVIWRVAALRAVVAVSAAGILIGASWLAWPRRSPTVIVPRPAMHLADAPASQASFAAPRRAAVATSGPRAMSGATGVTATPIDIEPLIEPAPVALANIQPAPIQIPLLQWNAIPMELLPATPVASSRTEGAS